MKFIENGLRYNTETSNEIANYDHYNNSNYCGTTRLYVTSKDNYFEVTESNGQNCWLNNSHRALTKAEAIEFLGNNSCEILEESKVEEITEEA